MKSKDSNNFSPGSPITCTFILPCWGDATAAAAAVFMKMRQTKIYCFSLGAHDSVAFDYKTKWKKKRREKAHHLSAFTSPHRLCRGHTSSQHTKAAETDGDDAKWNYCALLKINTCITYIFTCYQYAFFSFCRPSYTNCSVLSIPTKDGTQKEIE